MKARITLAAAAIAAAASATVALPAAAQTNVTVYGVADLYVGRYQLAGRESSSVVNSGGLSTSRWGLRAVEDLGGGLKVNVDITGFLRADTGEQGRSPADPLFGQRASLGLSGGFGSVDLGRVSTPIFVSMLATNPLGDASSFSPVFMHMYTGGMTPTAALFTQDNSANNSITYITPDLAGFKLRAQYAFGEVAGQTGRNRMGVSGAYDRGPLNVQVAYARDKVSIIAGETEQTTWLGGVSYDVGLVKLFGQYVVSDYDSLERETAIFQVGASVPVTTAGRIVASWARTDQDNATGVDPERNTVTVGYVHTLSKRTDLYALAMQDRLTSVDNGSSAVVGMRHRF